MHCWHISGKFTQLPPITPGFRPMTMAGAHVVDDADPLESVPR
jgi:hypothetical protein